MKIKNVQGMELADAIKSDVIRNILNCLGCGVGEHFNINNLRYNRLIIMTDADADGKHIEILLLSLFLNFLPELIKQGKIYTVQSPLFKTTTAREVKYWYEDNKEYRQYVRTHKLISLKRMKGLGEMPPQELYETTMDPNNRHLLQLTTEDIQKTLDLYSDLMGDKPSLRRDFILKNKFDDEDEYFEDDSEE